MARFAIVLVLLMAAGGSMDSLGKFFGFVSLLLSVATAGHLRTVPTLGTQRLCHFLSLVPLFCGASCYNSHCDLLSRARSGGKHGLQVREVVADETSPGRPACRAVSIGITIISFAYIYIGNKRGSSEKVVRERFEALQSFIGKSFFCVSRAFSRHRLKNRKWPGT